MLLLQLICMLSSTQFVASADGPFPIYADGTQPDEELIDPDWWTYSEGDPDANHLRCLRVETPVTSEPGYEYMIRAATVPEWPPMTLVTYVVKELVIHPLGCSMIGSEHKRISIPCPAITPNGGKDGRIDTTWGSVVQGVEYQACSAGSLQGYVLVTGLYKRRIKN